MFCFEPVRVLPPAREKAEKLAKLSVSDPILYAIERRNEANEINNTPVSYSLPRQGRVRVCLT